MKMFLFYYLDQQNNIGTSAETIRLNHNLPGVMLDDGSFSQLGLQYKNITC